MSDQFSNTNRISGFGKFFAVVQFSAALVVTISCMVAFWPDRMPPLKDGGEVAWYRLKAFHVTLQENIPGYNIKGDSGKTAENDNSMKVLPKRIEQQSDSATARAAATRDTFQSADESDTQNHTKIKLPVTDKTNTGDFVHLDIILLLLVALAGILGNLVHLASSFAAFVGTGNFQPSWTPWYYLRPLTAAGLALILYFVVRAGFVSTGPGGLSLWGILAMAAFAGLFTDIATLKLKEVFEALFKPKDSRSNKIDESFSVSGVNPATPIPHDRETIFTITGKNLSKQGVSVSFDGQPATITFISSDKIELRYMPSLSAGASKKTVLQIKDKEGAVLFTKDIAII